MLREGKPCLQKHPQYKDPISNGGPKLLTAMPDSEVDPAFKENNSS